jgi:hypothetical protein
MNARKAKLNLTRSSVMIGCPLCNLPLPEKMPSLAPAAPARTPQQQQQQQ